MRSLSRNVNDTMVALIEDQIHQFLIEQEEERCRALESEYNRSDETKGKIVKRKTIPKPWARRGENTLCQDTDLLIMVDEYDYDLSSNEFQRYCSTRGVLHIAGDIGSKRWEFFSDYRKLKSEYLADSYFRFAEEMDGKRYKYTIEELETSWRIILLGRAKLQDCWELFLRINET